MPVIMRITVVVVVVNVVVNVVVIMTHIPNKHIIIKTTHRTRTLADTDSTRLHRPPRVHHPPRPSLCRRLLLTLPPCPAAVVEACAAVMAAGSPSAASMVRLNGGERVNEKMDKSRHEWMDDYMNE